MSSETDCAYRPPRTWFLPNFAVLFAAASMPFFYWTTIFTIYCTLWQNLYGISAIMTAVYMLPIGILAVAVSFSGRLAKVIHPKWLILGGQLAALVSAIMFVFADSWCKYWSLVFPAFCIGTTGAMMAFTHTKFVSHQIMTFFSLAYINRSFYSIAIFRTAPPSMSGTVGALFNGALQLGSAVGIAAVTSIESSIEARSPHGAEGFEGRRAAYLFLVAVVAALAVAVAVFYRTTKPTLADTEEKRENSIVGKEPIAKEGNISV
jgi:MFS family permease